MAKEQESKAIEESTVQEVQESQTSEESTVTEKPKTTGEAVKEDTPQTTDPDATIKKLEAQKKAIAESQSRTAKELQENKATLDELHAKIEKMENDRQVRDLLLESELPTPIKAKLKGRIDTLTPETFEQVANDYVEIYNQGVEQQKTVATTYVTKTPEASAPKDIKDKLSSASNFDEAFDQLVNSGF